MPLFLLLIPTLLFTAPTIDRGLNLTLGGTPGYTITTDTAIARDKGSKSAVKWCELFDDTVSWYDDIYFSSAEWKKFSAENADHCERWKEYETE